IEQRQSTRQRTAATWAELSPLEQRPECFDVGEDRVARKRERAERSLHRVLITTTASIANADRDEAEIGGMPPRRLNSHLDREPHDGDRPNAAVAQSDRKWGPLEG